MKTQTVYVTVESQNNEVKTCLFHWDAYDVTANAKYQCDLEKKDNMIVMEESSFKNLIDAFQQVLRISDRDHLAWNKSKELIDHLSYKSKVTDPFK